MLDTACSVNHRAPSGPVVMISGPIPGGARGNSVTLPAWADAGPAGEQERGRQGSDHAEPGSREARRTGGSWYAKGRRLSQRSLLLFHVSENPWTCYGRGPAVDCSRLRQVVDGVGQVLAHARD